MTRGQSESRCEHAAADDRSAMRGLPATGESALAAERSANDLSASSSSAERRHPVRGSDDRYELLGGMRWISQTRGQCGHHVPHSVHMLLHRSLLVSIRLVQWLSGILGLGFLLLWPFSYHLYTSIGMDTDRLLSDSVLHHSYRLRWPGDGTVRLQHDQRLYAIGEERIAAVDFAFHLLERPPQTRIEGIRPWHGFSLARQQRGERKVFSWIGCPSWFPPLILLLPAIFFPRAAGAWSRTRD